MKQHLAAALFLLTTAVYVVFSYALTDPNLVLSSNSMYWSFQQIMWQLGYHQRWWLTLLYIVLTVFFWMSWLWIAKCSRSLQKKILAGVLFILFFAHPALSHDVYNYIFNAKMLVKYQLDPHVHSAQEISSDPWLRFMHNVHTSAPYGYGWTYASVLPYLIGLEKFTLTLGVFKVFMAVGWIGWLFTAWRLLRLQEHDLRKNAENLWWLTATLPLILVEHLATMHNDLWMMAFALGSFWSLFSAKNSGKLFWVKFLLSCILLFVSIWMKYVALVLLPLWMLLWFAVLKKNKFHHFQTLLFQWWGDAAVLLCFLPLFTERSQQFHPWYLAWPISFLPFSRSSALRSILLSFAVSSMLRYVPFLLSGEYTPEVLSLQRWITWAGAVLVFVSAWLVARVSAQLHARMRR